MVTQRFIKPIVGALLGMLFTISVQAVPVSSIPYFFRANIMNPNGSTADLLVIGTTVSPAQNTSAFATQGATSIVLPNTGFSADELSASSPYNPEQLDPWTVTAMNGLDTATSVTNDLFEVEALPFVSSINISGDLLTPMITWELPTTSLPYSRIRVRVVDFAGGALVFTSDALLMNATTYTLPSDVLQSDRDYVLRVMLEEVQGSDLVNRSDTRVTYTTYQGPVTITDSEVYYFRRTVRQEGTADRDEILLDAVSVKPSAGTTVTAKSLVDDSVNINLNFGGGGMFPNEFFARFPFDSVPVDVATGGFMITAENNGVQDQIATYDIIGVQPIGFLENVSIAGNPLAPTVSWTLPTVTAPFNMIGVRVLEFDANFYFTSSFSSPGLPATTTAYAIPAGVLKPDSERQAIWIRLSDVRSGVVVNRSEFRIPYSTSGLSNEVTLISHYYVSILRREPEAEGLAFWQNLIAERQREGMDVKPVFRQMADFFFNSAEYLGRNTTDFEFVTNLYLTFFQREPDEGGYTFWLEQLASGMTRNAAMAGFLYSAEFTDFMQRLGF
ncbi:MAG: DUF4214 domain-containing protein [Candidatus Competibacteraceae bacterium]|nr:DUF4214 domain-containing protein [Candidatus Competibacteraceae bacterium]